MPPPEELIRSGGATLAFDTNAILGFTRNERRVVFGAFLSMCDDVNRLRDELPRPLSMVIVVPSLARMEGVHHLRVERGKKPFDAKRAIQDLAAKNAAVAPFDELAAVKASGALHQWFPSDDLWHTAKRDRCLEILGLSRNDAPGQGGLASIDWAIAAQAAAEGWVLVTADSRAEFAHVPLKITKSRLRTLLDELLLERGVGSA
jgi:hypothetical protein